MTQPATYSCPHCQSLFSINDPSFYGKQIACPTCKQPVVISAPAGQTAPAPAPTQQVPNFGNMPPQQTGFPAQPGAAQTPLPSQDPFGSLPGPATGPAAGGQPSPLQITTNPPRGRGMGGPPKKKKQGGKRNLAPLVVVGAIVGILIPVGALSFFLMGGNRGADGNVVDMTWLPEDTEVLVYANVQKVVNSGLFQDHVASEAGFGQAMEQMKSETGLSYKDIESVTVGGPAEQSSNETVVVARLSVDLDESKLSRFTESEINGIKAFENAGNMLLLPDSRTVILGPKAVVSKVAEQGPAKIRRPQFDFADSSQDLFMCMVPKDKSAFRQNAGAGVPMMPGAPASMGKAMSILQSQTNGVAFGGSISGSDLDFKIQADMEDNTAGDDLKTGLNDLIAEGKTQYQQMSNMIPDPDLKTMIDGVINSVSIGGSGSAVSMSLNLPVGKLIELAKSGGMPFPGGSPFGPANPFDQLQDAFNL